MPTTVDADEIAIAFYEKHAPARRRRDLEAWLRSVRTDVCDTCWPKHRARPVAGAECGHSPKQFDRFDRCVGCFQSDRRRRVRPSTLDKSDEIDQLYKPIVVRREEVRRAERDAEERRVEAADARARSSTLTELCLAVIVTRPKLHRALCTADLVHNLPVPPVQSAPVQSSPVVVGKERINFRFHRSRPSKGKPKGRTMR
jgi:hypothetical protein